MESIYPGQRLGLPEEGQNSVATYGRRAGAFALDVVFAALATWPFTAPNLPQNWSLVSFFVLYFLGTEFVGRTLGMMATGLRLASDQPGRLLPLWKALARTVMVMVVVPALINNSDRRGLHDRVAGTTVVHA